MIVYYIFIHNFFGSIHFGSERRFLPKCWFSIHVCYLCMKCDLIFYKMFIGICHKAVTSWRCTYLSFLSILNLHLFSDDLPQDEAFTYRDQKIAALCLRSIIGSFPFRVSNQSKARDCWLGREASASSGRKEWHFGSSGYSTFSIKETQGNTFHLDQCKYYK